MSLGGRTQPATGVFPGEASGLLRFFFLGDCPLLFFQPEHASLSFLISQCPAASGEAVSDVLLLVRGVCVTGATQGPLRTCTHSSPQEWQRLDLGQQGLSWGCCWAISGAWLRGVRAVPLASRTCLVPGWPWNLEARLRGLGTWVLVLGAVKGRSWADSGQGHFSMPPWRQPHLPPSDLSTVTFQAVGTSVDLSQQQGCAGSPSGFPGCLRSLLQFRCLCFGVTSLEDRRGLA